MKCKELEGKLFCEGNECEGQYFQFAIEAETPKKALECAEKTLEKFGINDSEAFVSCRICNLNQTGHFTQPCLAHFHTDPCRGHSLVDFWAENE